MESTTAPAPNRITSAVEQLVNSEPLGELGTTAANAFAQFEEALTKAVQPEQSEHVPDPDSQLEPTREPQGETIRLFVGVDCNNSDLESQAVLEYSIRKYATQPVEITWMHQAKKGPFSGWNTAKARTPFSHFRWAVPALCEFEGKAIYTDSDFIFRADIADLWNQPLKRVVMLRHPEGKVRTCCMLIDCAKAKAHFPTIDTLRKMQDVQGEMLNYLRGHRDLLEAFPEGQDWNVIDLKGYDDINDPRIKAIHYSRIETQVHLPHAMARLAKEGRQHWYTGEVREHWRPELVALFDRLLLDARDAGYTLDRYRVSELIEGQTRRNFRYAHHKGAPQKAMA